VAVELDQSNAISAAAGHHEIAVRCCHHVTYDASARRNHPGLELLGLGIKTHQRVRTHRRFAIPHDVLQSGNSVRLGSWPAGRWPLADRSGLEVELAQIAE